MEMNKRLNVERRERGRVLIGALLNTELDSLFIL